MTNSSAMFYFLSRHSRDARVLPGAVIGGVRSDASNLVNPRLFISPQTPPNIPRFDRLRTGLSGEGRFSSPPDKPVLSLSKRGELEGGKLTPANGLFGLTAS